AVADVAMMATTFALHMLDVNVDRATRRFGQSRSEWRAYTLGVHAAFNDPPIFLHAPRNAADHWKNQAVGHVIGAIRHLQTGREPRQSDPEMHRSAHETSM